MNDGFYGPTKNVFYFGGFDPSVITFLTGVEGSKMSSPTNAEELFKTCVKTTFAVNENTADQIMQKASLLKKNDQLTFLSTTQLLEISKLIVAKNKPQNEAVLISLEAGILKRDALVNRDELLAEKGRLLDQKIKQDFESLLPAGWPDAAHLRASAVKPSLSWRSVARSRRPATGSGRRAGDPG